MVPHSWSESSRGDTAAVERSRSDLRHRKWNSVEDFFKSSFRPFAVSPMVGCRVWPGTEWCGLL